MGKNISGKNVSGKYSPKLLDHANKSTANALKTSSKRVIKKTAKATGDLIGKEIANKIAKNSQQNNSETVPNERDKEILKEKYVSPEERQESIDELGLK